MSNNSFHTIEWASKNGKWCARRDLNPGRKTYESSDQSLTILLTQEMPITTDLSSFFDFFGA